MTHSKTATIHGEPGERARTAGILRLFFPFVLTGVAIGFFIGLAFPSNRTLAGLGLLATAIALVWIIRDGLTSIASFFKGARGEERVAAILAMLPSGYHVFHNVSTGNGQTIDHVVIGPTGFFAIETKYWQGNVAVVDNDITINGNKPSRSPIQQALTAYRHLEHFCLSTSNCTIHGSAIVCFANNALQHPAPQTVQTALVCNADNLLTLIETASTIMTRVEQDRLTPLLEHKI